MINERDCKFCELGGMGCNAGLSFPLYEITVPRENRIDTTVKQVELCPRQVEREPTAVKLGGYVRREKNAEVKERRNGDDVGRARKSIGKVIFY